MMVFLLVLVIAIFAFGCRRPAIKEEETTATGRPSLVVELPQEGETITGPNVTIRISVRNLRLEPPGLVKQAGVGHIHYYLDSKLQMSPEEAFTFTGVTTGEHTLRILLVQKDHTPFSPSVEKKIRINVLSPGAQTGTAPPSPPGY
jgi:hypothetical protein